MEGLDATRVERKLSDFEETDEDEPELFGGLVVDAKEVIDALENDQEKAQVK